MKKKNNKQGESLKVPVQRYNKDEKIDATCAVINKAVIFETT